MLSSFQISVSMRHPFELYSGKLIFPDRVATFTWETKNYLSFTQLMAFILLPQFSELFYKIVAPKIRIFTSKFEREIDPLTENMQYYILGFPIREIMSIVLTKKLRHNIITPSRPVDFDLDTWKHWTIDNKIL